MAVNARLKERLDSVLAERKSSGTMRRLRVCNPQSGLLNLANNDYLGFAGDAELKEAGRDAIDRYGCSASASPLVSGFGPAHQELLNSVKAWHGFEQGIVWNSGYVANQAVLSQLPKKEDVVLADRLIHNSMITGILSSGARLARYRHCDLDHLEALLQKHGKDGRLVFVATESVFSMDGDYPDLARMAELKERYGFFWILDEAHAIGWYGDKGSGLAESLGVADKVDVLVGTLGKALASMGAYTLFHDKSLSEYLINRSGEFIYSTYLPPTCAAIARAAVRKVKESRGLRAEGGRLSSKIRKLIQETGREVDLGDSPIVSVILGNAEAAVELAAKLEAKGILVGAIRPPTVPEGTSRLRISLKADLSEESIEKLIHVLETT